MRINLLDRKMRVAATLLFVAVAFIVDIGMRAYAQQQKKAEAVKKEESFSRPKPTRPIKPEIPGVNRYQKDKIFLEYADSLFKVQSWGDTTERQIVKGNVKFRQAGMWMYCDSAYYYPNRNSLDAFGHVRMEQGDTLFVYADKLYYEGNERMARLKNGPSNPKVKLINRDVTLTTDSLDYSLAIELGWYERWGTIDDKVNTLTSLYGEYSPGTKNADFYNYVELVNNRDGYKMYTDTLHYNTDTHIARIESKTEIQGENDTILTTEGMYNTQVGYTELLSRSTIIHRDSNNNVTTLEGDSIIYDKATRISRAYMFRDPNKHGMPMILTDTAHRTTLIGGFGIYNDSTRDALATDYPLLMEYSQGDTLFLRADTIKTYIVTAMVAASRRWTRSGFPEYDGRVVVRADSGSIWIEKLFFSLVAPMSEAPLRLLEAALPEKKQASAETAKVTLPEKLGPKEVMTEPIDSILSSSDSLKSPLSESLMHIAAANAKIAAADSLSSPDGKLSVSSDGEPEDSVAAASDDVAKDSVPLLPKEFHIALAYHRARFFKQDMQGVADSMVLVESDSMLYMFRKPIVWSGERQVTGNRVDVHFNDSTADWALLPESGMLSEHVDEDFYNQLAGKKLFATFADQTLKGLDVSGNVETIFLPQESDSTFNRMVTAESSYLTLELDSGKMKKLKMWPEVSGNVAPLFMVKKANQYLRQFRWWSSLRPVREWYGDRWRWQDDLGEVPDDLEAYFKAPSDFGAPKSFPASRPVAAPVPSAEVAAVDTLSSGGKVNPLDSVSTVGPANLADSVQAAESRVINENVGGEGASLKQVERNEQEMKEENKEIIENSEKIEEKEERSDSIPSLGLKVGKPVEKKDSIPPLKNDSSAVKPAKTMSNVDKKRKP